MVGHIWVSPPLLLLSVLLVSASIRCADTPAMSTQAIGIRIRRMSTIACVCAVVIFGIMVTAVAADTGVSTNNGGRTLSVPTIVAVV